ncbi:hypothetical protein B0H16DRAFT_240531 [Mycena metata]|uniref:Nephrocystin 3-like N-terminal domain-containing protein n=1 Tax=Mycena metata TaxID=1033252 RepID=A0AAD7HWC2_9AGAR|nr:hypothetical protein B0H16DRAFT_240531 [Mycena metata]
MFSNGSNFQITGGRFINVGGDFHFDNEQAALNGPDIFSALDRQNSGHLLGGIDGAEGGLGSGAHRYDTSERRRIMAPSYATDAGESGSTPTSYFYSPLYGQDAQLQLYQQPTSDGPSLEDQARGFNPVGAASGPATPNSKPIRSGPGVDMLLSTWGPSAQNPGLIFPSNHPATTNITGGTFIGGNVSRIQHHGEAGLHILHRAIAGDAFHDSAERYPQPQCHPDTRTKLLEVLSEWAHSMGPVVTRPVGPFHDWPTLSEEPPKSHILWLHGPAGAGKSAVAQSVCQKLQDEGRLGGAFFFKRGHPSRGNAKKLFPTIAYQLAFLLPELKRHISHAIENDPAIVDRSLSTQLHGLILDPCRKAQLVDAVPIIIDGLDECDGENVQQAILRAISRALSQESVPLLFLVASRPEAHIRETLVEPCLVGNHRALNIEQSFEDVGKYLEVEFDRIHREHQTMTAVPFPWPEPEIVRQIVRDSSGYFIYAATIIKFIDDKRFQPQHRLDVILRIRHSISGSPLNPLDQLYLQIFSGVPEDFHAQLLQILVFVKQGVYLQQISRTLEIEVSELHLILRGLHSVLDVPEHDWRHVSAYHASFWDFLDDPSRSGAFHIGSALSRKNLAFQLLKTLSHNSDHTWDIHVLRTTLEHIASADPSPDLLPLVQSMNPDSLLQRYKGHERESVATFLSWLKTFTPRPQGLIDIWEDYAFMFLCDHLWWNESPTWLAKGGDLTRVSLDRETLKILYACKVAACVPGSRGNSLFMTRRLLGLSWDKFRAAFCSMRGILGQDLTQPTNRTWIVDERVLATFDAGSVMAELAKACWGQMHAVIRGQMSLAALREIVPPSSWGVLVRACPPPGLLNDLSELAEALDCLEEYWVWPSDFYNLLQCLKTLSPIPVELVNRLEHKLGEENRDQMEEDWMKWWQQCQEYSKHLTIC